MRPIRAFPMFCLPALLLAGCIAGEGEAEVDIAIIGDPADFTLTGLRLTPAAQHLRAATAEGLVAFDLQGNVVPAAAERWIVTDDGLSYIFRLRDRDWPDGRPMTARSVKTALDRARAQLDGTSLGLDLAVIEDVRAMAGRVVEIRLRQPMGQFLPLLAQPELGLRQGRAGIGPMVLAGGRATGDAQAPPLEDGAAIVLTAMPPEERGLPEREDWDSIVRPVNILAMDAADAVARFEDGSVDAVFNGHIANLSLADTGPLARGTIRIDPVNGLLGLRVARPRGVLAEADLREALAMALDRENLLQAFNVGGWQASTRIVPVALWPATGASADADTDGNSGAPAERWGAMTLEERRAQASRRIARWQQQSGARASVSIALDSGPGSARVFEVLQADLATIGVVLTRAEGPRDADLLLVDRAARYDDPLWFLNQFNCAVRRNVCSAEADSAVATSLTETDPSEQVRLRREAEDALLALNSYIPLGAPVRWSLVRGGVDGFAASPTGLHPLFPLARRPI